LISKAALAYFFANSLQIHDDDTRIMMATNTDESKIFDAKDNAKSSPRQKVEKKSGSPPDGLSQSKEQIRLNKYRTDEITEQQPPIGLQNYATGASPLLSETTPLAQATHHASPFQQVLLKMGDYLIVLSAALLGRQVNDRRKLFAHQKVDPFKAAPNLEDHDNTSSDLTPRISALAHDLSEAKKDKDGSTMKNWRQAERDVRHISPSIIPLQRESAMAEEREANGSESCIS
jgi:hypothetical protein